MTIPNPIYFDPFYSNRLLNFKITMVDTVANTVKLAMHIFRIHTFKTGIIRSFNKDLGKVYIMVVGLKSAITNANFNKEEVKEEYIIAQNALKKFRSIAAKFEKRNYFGLKETEQLCNNILIEFYDIEFKLRIIAFSDTKADDGDEELNRISSIVSINSLRSIHADAI